MSSLSERVHTLDTMSYYVEFVPLGRRTMLSLSLSGSTKFELCFFVSFVQTYVLTYTNRLIVTSRARAHVL